ncbi:MAG: hypothetical protein OEY56_03655 [Cyclobacteriaceae bacterium]|nr:hypothetical protein [Cyclobacteriaceae bacterium]
MRAISHIILWGWILASCTYYEIPPLKIPEPPRSDETTDLIAEYVATAPGSTTHPYWNTADYVLVSFQNITTGQIPSDMEMLHSSGMLAGVTGFNNGQDGMLKIKAAYDDDFLYVLADWKDATLNPNFSSWLFMGPADPNMPSVDVSGWSGQKNDDNLMLAFHKDATTKDVWNWSLALSEPLGYAIDMYDDGSSIAPDAGDAMYVRNKAVTGGPMYEWDGVQQEVTRETGGFTILDPAYYLLNKTAFVGDIVQGEALFQAKCSICHGPQGDGNGTEWITNIALNGEGALNRLSRSAFKSFASSADHSGASHFNEMTEPEKDDLIARIRGFSGVPGYFLSNPAGSVSDVFASSNVNLARITTRTANQGYTVLFKRALVTGKADDLDFDPTKGAYTFDVFVMDNDEINKIGETGLTLTFN